METTYAVIEGGKVVNIIVAEAPFVATYIGEAIRYDDVPEKLAIGSPANTARTLRAKYGR